MSSSSIGGGKKKHCVYIAAENKSLLRFIFCGRKIKIGRTDDIHGEISRLANHGFSGYSVWGVTPMMSKDLSKKVLSAVLAAFAGEKYPAARWFNFRAPDLNLFWYISRREVRREKRRGQSI